MMKVYTLDEMMRQLLLEEMKSTEQRLRDEDNMKWFLNRPSIQKSRRMAA